MGGNASVASLIAVVWAFTNAFVGQLISAKSPSR
jgi:hypothetical protein